MRLHTRLIMGIAICIAIQCELENAWKIRLTFQKITSNSNAMQIILAY
jgi:hypothetical protein